MGRKFCGTIAEHLADRGLRVAIARRADVKDDLPLRGEEKSMTTRRAKKLEELRTELSKLCSMADDEGFEMIAYFIETAIREADEQLLQETRAIKGLELRLHSPRSL